jgi:hypothetical protein
MEEHSGNEPEDIEEIQRELTHPKDVPPRPVRIFMRRGGFLVEVVEEGEAAEQVKALEATLASVSTSLRVSRDALSIGVAWRGLQFFLLL